MKKLFVSCPMKGRTEENIKSSIEKMHKIAEVIFGEELEIINAYVTSVPTNGNKAVWMLGYSIQLLSEADFFIGVINYSDKYHGCMIERETARRYGIRSTLIDMTEIMPDIISDTLTLGVKQGN